MVKTAKVRSGHFIMPSKPHSERVKTTAKQQRTQSRREARNARDMY